MLVVDYNCWLFMYTNSVFCLFPNCEYFWVFFFHSSGICSECPPLFIPLHSFTAGNQIAVNIAKCNGPELQVHFSSVEMAALAPAQSSQSRSVLSILAFLYYFLQIWTDPCLKSASGLCFIHNIYILITSTVFIFESLSFTAIYLRLETQHALFWGILEY